MASEVLRKLIDGVWRTVVADAGGNGGSQTHVAVVNRLGAAAEVGFNEFLPFDNVVYDPDGLWDANNLQMVAKIAGLYRLTAWSPFGPVLQIVDTGSGWSTSLKAENGGGGYDVEVDAFAAAPGSGWDAEVDGLAVMMFLDADAPTDLISQSDGTVTFTNSSHFAFELVAAT